VNFLRAAVAQVIKLFVSDWTQTAGIALILVVGLLLARQLSSAPVGFGIGILLALHLVFTTSSEARRLRG
jgi:hypothetical protein